MYLHINIEHVIIDVTPECKYVGKNDKTDKVVIVTDSDKAIGVLGSNDVIRSLLEKTVIKDFYNVLEIVPCDNLPEDYEPCKYVWNNGEFELYEGVAPKDVRTLTEENEELEARADETDETLDDILTNIIPELIGE